MAFEGVGVGGVILTDFRSCICGDGVCEDGRDLASAAAATTEHTTRRSTEGYDTGDLFDANQAMQYITYLTIGYMIARGLAKSVSREHYNDVK